ncbi:MAG: NAD(P)/FAD-dependent oxidoreductase [Spirochaetia bacterium]
MKSRRNGQAQNRRHSQTYKGSQKTTDIHRQEVHDALIIGAGPAGMACAAALYRNGVDKILLVERNSTIGGILNQCIHTGFGLTYFKEDLTGPEFAKKLGRKVKEGDIPLRLETMVGDIESTCLGDKELLTASLSSAAGGRETVYARSVVLATGCRERTRENLLISGARPAGVYTAGQAQDLINIRGLSLGRRVVVQGSGDIGLIMARRLTIEGYEVAAVLERLPYLSGLIRNKVQCLDHFSIPLRLGREIHRIEGKDRVKGVEVRGLDINVEHVQGKEEFIECDTVLFSVGLIPEIETAKSAGVLLNNGFNPVVDDGFQTNVPGLFVCGNALHIHDLADSASREGEKTARRVSEYLASRERFRRARSSRLPYREPVKDTSRTAEYFERIEKEGKLICIICPRGCEVTESEAGCEKGIDFFLRQRENPSQRMATTVWSDSGEYGSPRNGELPPASRRSSDSRRNPDTQPNPGARKARRIPVVSRGEVSAAQIRELKKSLTRSAPGSIARGYVEVSSGSNHAVFVSPEASHDTKSEYYIS